jgi:DNA-binding transcriptional LysR family regulator
LRQHTLIANSAAPHLNHWPFARDGQAWKLAIDGHWRANDSGLTASMVLEGLGIGRLAVIVAEPLVQQGRLLPVLADWVDAQPIPIVAVTASNRQRLPKIRACLGYWTEWFARFNDTPPG